MTDQMKDDEFAARIARPLRAAERVAPDFESRAMSAVKAAAAARRTLTARRVSWWLRPRAIAVSPLAGLAAAAGLVAIALAGAGLLADRDTGERPAAVASVTDTVHVVRFVLVQPDAQRVALVGGFNGWRKDATILQSRGSSGVWTVDVPLAPGRHEYAFVVYDERGERWIADPATLTKHDEFGTESSIISVGRRSES